MHPNVPDETTLRKLELLDRAQLLMRQLRAVRSATPDLELEERVAILRPMISISFGCRENHLSQDEECSGTYARQKMRSWRSDGADVLSVDGVSVWLYESESNCLVVGVNDSSVVPTVEAFFTTQNIPLDAVLVRIMRVKFDTIRP